MRLDAGFLLEAERALDREAALFAAISVFLRFRLILFFTGSRFPGPYDVRETLLALLGFLLRRLLYGLVGLFLGNHFFLHPFFVFENFM